VEFEVKKQLWRKLLLQILAAEGILRKQLTLGRHKKLAGESQGRIFFTISLIIPII
jgi:hypothetical protein